MTQRVLIVEDDPDAREALEELLANRGFETASAGDAEAAISTAVDFRPDVLLCDWRLPGERDGISVARALQTERDIPVIFYTAHSVAELRAHTRDLPVLAYLPKPIDVGRLTAALNAFQ